jgi:hypothetical protein
LGAAKFESARRQAFSTGQIEASAVEITIDVAREGGFAIIFFEECL